MLGANARVIKARGHRVRLGDLAVVVAQHVGAVAVQDADAAGRERCRMAAAGDALARCFRADDAHARIVEEGVENADRVAAAAHRSEEHTSELQSLMRISYAVFCLKKKKKPHKNTN